MFESIQVSYELLLPLLESGQTVGDIAGGVDKDAEEGDSSRFVEDFPGGKHQMQTMHLLIKTQLLICRRFEKDMARYKYPAYGILLDCLKLPQSCLSALDEGTRILDTSLVHPARALFTLDALKLVYHTCLVSPLNSEELVAESGVSTLVDLLGFYMKLCNSSAMLADGKHISNSTLMESVTFIVRTLSGVAFFESGRSAILRLGHLASFLVSWCGCIKGTECIQKKGDAQDAAVRRYALEGIINMAKDSSLQEQLIGAGVVWPLLMLALMFDPTLDEETTSTSCNDDVGISLAATNVQARLSVRALGMLSGALKEAPLNEPLQKCLSQLLTEPVARMLRNRRTGEILRILNTNVEMPDIIWNLSMRNQLESALSKIKEERAWELCQPLSEELSVVGDFQYEALKNEVQIAGVYVRVFNKGGKDGVSHVSNPSAFMVAVTNFIARSLNGSGLDVKWVPIPIEDTDSAGPKLFTSVSEPSFLMAVKALRILLEVNGLVDDLLLSSPCIIPSTMLSLVELPPESEVSSISWLVGSC